MLEELREFASNLKKKTGQMSTWKRLDLELLGSRPLIMPKKPPLDTDSKLSESHVMRGITHVQSCV